MATPEQNMLLAMQLFQRPADQYREDSAMRNNVMLRLVQAKQEEQLRRDLAIQQATREDARWDAQGKREDARIKASDTRQEQSIASAERRQQKAQTEKERLDIENEIDRFYRLYTGAAERAGMTPNKRETYPTTRAGLGQLQADAASAEFAVQKRQDQLSATAMLTELESAQAEVDAIAARRQEFAKPSASDQKIARSTAVQALQEKLDEFPSVKKLGDPAIQKGLAALRSGDPAEAGKLLGSDVLQAFDATYEQVLQQLPGTRVRMQQSAQLQQTESQARANLDKYRSLLAQAASKNPTLAEGFAKSQKGIRSLMTTEAAAPRPTIEDVMRRQFGDAPPADGGIVPPPKSEPAPTFLPPRLNSLQYGTPASAGMVGFQGASTPPSLSKRMNATPSADVPAPIIQVPPREPAPMIRIPPPEPAPIIQLPPDMGGAAGYPAFRDSLGSSAVNQLIRRPVAQEFSRTQDLYGDKQADPDYVRSLQIQRLTELLHGGQFNTSDERALARSKIYELLGVAPSR